ncbi:hypothetical protein BsWGS_26373 [Bradybaena similaris]
MTMSNFVMSSPQRTGASLRKTNKPLMEKRRRARINDSLTQLKSLVIQSNKKDSSQFNKLEKADILELTVKHLRNLQEQQQQQLSQVHSNASLTGKYQAGFMECANEVIRYLGQSQGFTDDLKSRVVHHLASCIQLSNKIAFAKTGQSNTSVTSPPVLPSVSSNAGQLVSGQLVQIASGHYPNIKPAITGSFPAGVTASMSQLTSVSSAPTHIPTAITSPATTTTTPSSEATGFLKYTQPLQIQIPAVTSPVILQANTTQQQPDRCFVLYKVKDVPEQVIKAQDLSSQVNTQVNTQVNNLKQETFVSSPPSPPPTREKSTSPYPLNTCRNSLKCYDPQYSDFIPRSRTYSLTSSSSSETELSPLNLSQSPQYYDHRELNAHHPSSFCKQTSQVSSHSSQASSHSNQASWHSRQTSSHSSQISNSQTATTDRLLLPSSPSCNLASVIVDGRKTAESHFMKYMHYIDEDRHYGRHEGSASPASSVGEERLWRPW